MQIAVSGTHSIGKTTLTKYISELLNVPIIGEQARELLERKYVFKEVDQSIEKFKQFQSDILEAQVSLEHDYRKAGKSFVVDRTPMDSLAYVRERLTSERDLDVDYYKSYRRKVLSFMRNNLYNRVYFIRYNSIFHEDDGNRNLNPFLMETIDSIMDSEFKSSRVPLLEISTTVWEARQELVKTDLLGGFDA